MPAESPFASAAELPTCTSDASPVSSSSSAGPTRANTPDLEQHPDLRAVSDREEDVLFFGGAEILDNDNDDDAGEEGPSVPSSSERGGAVQGPLTIMETLVRVERASEVAVEARDGGRRAAGPRRGSEDQVGAGV
ncbi:hypothetical protein HO133_004247 [Letharia lupina]|uniref:Uncharacterized protein n=1 Tax=Letharia lupina TaxID=560253 RepID=A0A8H6FK13_9LECA|nr:uncharacterized protein HO133_004247 [Letharia lupina]KAF6229910.1 hypothetical protein HO133_004247 [Letharia lupina]